MEPQVPAAGQTAKPSAIRRSVPGAIFGLLCGLSLVGHTDQTTLAAHLLGILGTIIVSIVVFRIYNNFRDYMPNRGRATKFIFAFAVLVQASNPATTATAWCTITFLLLAVLADAYSERETRRKATQASSEN